eukprot:729698-Hanusia_phi.AAC.1
MKKACLRCCGPSRSIAIPPTPQCDQATLRCDGCRVSEGCGKRQKSPIVSAVFTLLCACVIVYILYRLYGMQAYDTSKPTDRQTTGGKTYVAMYSKDKS